MDSEGEFSGIFNPSLGFRAEDFFQCGTSTASVVVLPSDVAELALTQIGGSHAGLAGEYQLESMLTLRVHKGSVGCFFLWFPRACFGCVRKRIFDSCRRAVAWVHDAPVWQLLLLSTLPRHSRHVPAKVFSPEDPMFDLLLAAGLELMSK